MKRKEFFGIFTLPTVPVLGRDPLLVSFLEELLFLFLKHHLLQNNKDKAADRPLFSSRVIMLELEIFFNKLNQIQTKLTITHKQGFN